jgi:hypothetical protein
MAPFLENHIHNSVALIKFPSLFYGMVINFKWVEIIGEENLTSKCFNFLTSVGEMARWWATKMKSSAYKWEIWKTIFKTHMPPKLIPCG